MEAQAAARAQHLSDQPMSGAPAKESKAQAFERLAPPRVEKALLAIRLVGNLAARGQYEYHPEDVEAITATLQRALDDMAARFRERPRQETFKLPR